MFQRQRGLHLLPLTLVEFRKMRFVNSQMNKKGQFAETMIVVCGIILLVAAMVAVSLSHQGLPGSTNTATTQILQIDQTFDTLEFTADQLISQAVSSVTIDQAISASGCYLADDNWPTSTIGDSVLSSIGTVGLSASCTPQNILFKYQKMTREAVNNQFSLFEANRKSLINGGYTFYNSLAYDSNEQIFSPDSFVVYLHKSLDANSQISTNQFEDIVISRIPLNIKRTSGQLWSLDASRTITYKTSINSADNLALLLFDSFDSVDSAINLQIAAFSNKRADDIQKTGSSSLTNEDLLNMVSASLKLLTTVPLTQNNLKSNTNWNLILNKNNIIIVFPQLKLVKEYQIPQQNS